MLSLARLTRHAPAFIAAALVGPMALAAEEAKDPDVKARIALMQALKAETGTLADMVSGKAPFDAVRAEAAIEVLRADADRVEPVFKPRADDPASEALPDIWNAPSEFRQKTNRLVKATMELDGGSLGALGDSLNTLGAACKDCHGRFKM